MMEPAEYLREIVLPTVLEYEQDTSSRRKCYLACVVVFHLSDQLKKSGAGDVARNMRSRCGDDWKVVHAVATAAKHFDNHENQNELKFVVGHDMHRPAALAGEFECGSSLLGDLEGTHVIPNMAGDDYYEVLTALRAVLEQYQQAYECLCACSSDH